MANITHKFASSVSTTTGSQSGSATESGNSELRIDENFATNSNSATLALAFTVTNVQSLFLVADKGCTITTNNTNTADVQTVTITGTPTGGTFPLSYNGAVTGFLYNSNAATVQSGLQGLSTIGNGNMTCSGGPLPGTPIVCTFAGTLNKGFRPLMATSSAQLTGGTNAAVAVAHTTPGKPSDTIVLAPGVPRRWQQSEVAMGLTNPFTIDVTQAFVTCTTATKLSGYFLFS